MERVFAEMEADAVRWLQAEGIRPAERSLQRLVSLRYRHQGFELTMPWQDLEPDAALVAACEAFHARHLALYTFDQRDVPVEVVTLHVEAVGRLTPPEMPRLSRHGSLSDARRTAQIVHFAEGTEEAPVYDRSALGAGAEIKGPAILVQLDSTTLILPGQFGRVDEFGNLIVSA
jgi:N-methylhydantoinase A